MAFSSPIKFSLALAGALLFVVIGLNFVKSPEVPVSPEQFQRLSLKGLIVQIKITQTGLSCRLEENVRLEYEGREVFSQDIILLGKQEVPPEQVSRWRAEGIAVEYDDETGTSSREWVGIGLVGSLLGLGLWHLWSQIQKDRKGDGSPRRRLQTLEKEFREGKISLEDYEQAREAIWAEM